MTETMTHPHTLVLPRGLDVCDIPRRACDFTRGDGRFKSQAAAVDWAEDQALRTGVRQVVRSDGSLWLVQAVGS